MLQPAPAAPLQVDTLGLRRASGIKASHILVPALAGWLGAVIFGLPGAVIGAVGGYLLVRNR
jgi:hypothetical protein